MRPRSRVKIPACRPYFESFTRRERLVPRVVGDERDDGREDLLRLDLHRRASCPSRIVGEDDRPVARPARENASRPPATASSTHASARTASSGAIIGPTSVFSSSGSPDDELPPSSRGASRGTPRRRAGGRARAGRRCTTGPRSRNAPAAARDAASSRSASEWTTTPRSRPARGRRAFAARAPSAASRPRPSP